MSNLHKYKEAMYILAKKGNMRVPGLIVATEKLLQEEEIHRTLEQVKNVARLPGIVNYSIAMPDIHWGYGFPIGGVAAMDINEGVISPGGVGYDINCGVRLALIPEKFSNFSDKIKKQLIHEIFRSVPSGVGHGHRGDKMLTDTDYENIAKKGVAWSIEQGYGFEEDIQKCENAGNIADADASFISSHAKERGKKQLGTVGSGNHFIEIGAIEDILLPEIAKEWKIEKDQTYVLIHSGSRGFGHQICQDTLHSFMKKGFAENLPDKQLVAAPIQSKEGKEYLQSMATAANYAFNNRQQILHYVRQAFANICNIAMEKIPLLYDVCHNIAKIEEHKVNNKNEKLCIHRKGATLALGPNANGLSPIYQKTGQPVIVPGDMGRASFLLVGQGNEMTWSSCCHGAGRAKSRIQSTKTWKGKDLKTYMQKQGITVLASSYRTIAEEMPDAYKNICDVIDAVDKANLAKPVAKMKPSLVIKG